MNHAYVMIFIQIYFLIKNAKINKKGAHFNVNHAMITLIFVKFVIALYIDQLIQKVNVLVFKVIMRTI